ncbi:MAG: NAD(P)/FAD-dependent oxidoreductase, partial [Caulobacteraceae bacterium]
MSLGTSVDVAIIGGGVMGSAAAYFLTALGPGLKIAVFEPDPSYARASSTASAGGIRQQFSAPENILMSRFGLDFLAEAADRLEVRAGRPNAGFRPRGYLVICSEGGRGRLRENWRLACGLGAPLVWLEAVEIARRFPWMNTEDMAAASLGTSGEGTFDPHGLLQALRAKAIEQGAGYRDRRVVAIDRATNRIAAVRLDDGERVAASWIVNAAGPRAAEVAAMAGIDLPVIPVKAETFFFRCREGPRDCPIVLDRGLQFRPEGEGYICSAHRSAEPEPAGEDFTVDYADFEARIWPALAAR